MRLACWISGEIMRKKKGLQMKKGKSRHILIHLTFMECYYYCYPHTMDVCDGPSI